VTQALHLALRKSTMDAITVHAAASVVTRGLGQGGKLSERGPTSNPSETSWKIITNPDVDIYTNTRNHQNTLRTTQQTSYTENQKNTKYRNISEVEGQFLLLACRDGSSHPCPSSVTPLVTANTEKSFLCQCQTFPARFKNFLVINSKI